MDGSKPNGQAAASDGARAERASILSGIRVLEISVSLLTLVILVVGLLFTYLQTDRVKISIERTKFNALENDLQEVNRVFIEYPELQKYFLSGKDIAKTDPDYNRVYAIAVTIAMNLDESTGDLKGDRDLFQPGTWTRYYRFQFGASPILCRLLLQDHDIYGGKIVAIARRDCTPAPPRPINPQ